MNANKILLARRRMVQEQIIDRGIINPKLLSAMESVPRHRFVPEDDLPWAYTDGPLPIGEGQTISQPYIVALMTELLEIKPTSRLLEVGTGSGYQAAVLGKLAAEVHSIEIIPTLAARAAAILHELGYLNIHVHNADGSMGWLDDAPYDGILVAAAAPSAPKVLLEQLNDQGRMVIPVGNFGFQQLEVWQRQSGKFDRQINIPVAFVPLRGEYGWK